MKRIEENMAPAGFGKLLEVSGAIYKRSFPGEPDEVRFFAHGDTKIDGCWEKVEDAHLVFREYQPGGMNKPQYVCHRYAKWRGVVEIEESTAIIRLPPTTMARKRAYMRAAGARRQALADWIFETCDRAAQTELSRNP